MRSVITKTSDVFPLLLVVTADKDYDSEVNYMLVREEDLGALSVIPARYEHVLIWKIYIIYIGSK